MLPSITPHVSGVRKADSLKSYLATLDLVAKLDGVQLGLPAHGLLLSLLGFNVGVELGQALVVALCLPLLILLRRTRWSHAAVVTSSAAILVVGVVLFVERAFL